MLDPFVLKVALALFRILVQKEIGYKSEEPGYAGLIDEAQNYMVIQASSVLVLAIYAHCHDSIATHPRATSRGMVERYFLVMVVGGGLPTFCPCLPKPHTVTEVVCF